MRPVSRLQEVKMKVYIIRHGEVPHNVLNQYNNKNEDLTDKGIMQAL